MSKFGVCVLSLGYTRLAGLTVYDSKTREFIETKPGDAKRMIKAGLIHGVKYDKEKEYFVPDPEFNMKDLLIKSGVGNYRSMLNEIHGEPAKTAYILVRVLETNVGKIYEIVNNRCQRVKLTEEQLRGLHEIGNIGGVFITDDKIEVCKGVVIENRRYPDDTQFVGLPLNTEGAVQAILNENTKNNEVVETENTGPVEGTEVVGEESTGPVESTEVVGDANISEPSETADNKEPAEDKKEKTLADVFGAENSVKTTSGSRRKTAKKK